MKKRKTKPLILAMAVACAIVTVLTASFAWFTAQDRVTNHLETESLTNGDAKIVEIFDPDEPINPGTTVDKKVGVVNTGSSEAFVRISFVEAIQKLANNGAPAAITTKFDGTASMIPQLFDEAAIATGGAYATWTQIATGDTNFEAASLASFLTATADVEVRYNKTTANGKTYYEYIAYAPLSGLSGDNEKYNGKYQLVNINISINADDEISLNGLSYMQFTQDTPVDAKWAALTNHTAFAAYALQLNKPAIVLPGATSHVDALVNLNFSSAVKTNLSACSTGDWWYNTNDGYFYYIGKLASGAQTANWLLQSVSLDKSASNAYCNLNYDLTPCMDAIQAIDDAVGDAAGWNLSGDPNYADLIAALTA